MKVSISPMVMIQFLQRSKRHSLSLITQLNLYSKIGCRISIMKWGIWVENWIQKFSTEFVLLNGLRNNNIFFLFSIFFSFRKEIGWYWMMKMKLRMKNEIQDSQNWIYSTYSIHIHIVHICEYMTLYGSWCRHTIVCANTRVYKFPEHLSGPPKKFSILKRENCCQPKSDQIR